MPIKCYNHSSLDYLKSKAKIFDLLDKIRPNRLASPFYKLFASDESRCLIELEGIQYLCNPASFLTRSILREGTYEPHTIAVLRKYLRKGDTFIDIGANEGFLSAIALSLIGDTGCLVAVEPQQDIFRVLQMNVALNAKCPAHLLNYAVSNQKQEQQLFLAPQSNTGGSSLVRGPFLGRRSVIQTTTFLDVVETTDIGKVCLIKIDVEGFEKEVIESITQSNFQGISRILLSYHTSVLARRGIEPSDIERMLFDVGFSRRKGQSMPEDPTSDYSLIYENQSMVDI